MGRKAVNLDVNVLFAPEGNSRQPVLLLDCLASAGPVLWRKYARLAYEFGAGDFASYGARSDPHLGIVTDTLVFARVAPSHYVDFVTFLPEPDWRRYGDAALAEGGQAYVFLALNLKRDGHEDIVRAARFGAAENAKTAGES